jgi:predicted DNA-binding transcriptional regulator AlpA
MQGEQIYLSFSDVMHLTGKSRNWVDKMIRAGRFVPVQGSGRRAIGITTDSFKAWAEGSNGTAVGKRNEKTAL